MGTSNRLRTSDIGEVFQLLGECRELWSDAEAWQHHLLRGACRLTGTAIGTYTESWLSSDRTWTQIFDETSYGWHDSAAQEAYQRVLTEHPDRVSYLRRVYRLAALAMDGREDEATMLRPEMRSNADWYRSEMYNRYVEPADLDGFVMSFALNRHTGNLVTLHLAQHTSDRPPNQHAKSITMLIARQLAPLVGVTLATRRQRGRHGLTRRLRQTLDALLEGQSEKQVASNMGISNPTVHEYVSAIYRHFGVASRGELMAYFLRRKPETRSTSVMSEVSRGPLGAAVVEARA